MPSPSKRKGRVSRAAIEGTEPQSPSGAGRPFCAVPGEPLPLPSLLSQVLVSFTIECDNESEHRTAHTTTRYGSAGGARQGPWLVSMNCMRFVGPEGITVRELERRARTQTNLNGIERWGYITIAPDPADARPKPPLKDWVIHATLKCRIAQEVWRPLSSEIEQRWEARFGKDEIDGLRESLRAVVRQIDPNLPDCLPILKYGLVSEGPDPKLGPRVGNDDIDSLPLAALLSRVLLAFAMEFERESDLSLAICADVLRVLDEKGVLVRDLPLLSGVSKEAIAMAFGILQKKRGMVVEPDPRGSRAKIARLTTKGRAAQEAYRELLATIEGRWQVRFGKDAIRALRLRLARLVQPLFQALEPYPGGWRAKVRKPETLPHYPMVLHRGGFPDGS
ncbi:MAG: hypothetical protein ACLP59_26045 [Bryobacteraceae bacterium]